MHKFMYVKMRLCIVSQDEATYHSIKKRLTASLNLMGILRDIEADSVSHM